MLNSVVLVGRLTKNPELKTTNSGTSVCSFTIAVDRRFDRDKTDFFNIVTWQKTAEFVSKYFHKGEYIAIQGELQNRTFEKDGQSRQTTEVIANNVSFCGNSTKGEAEENNPISIEVDEELPF